MPTDNFPPSFADMADSLHREGYFEWTTKMLQARQDTLLREIHEQRAMISDMRRACEVAESNRHLAELDVEDWKALAMKYGTITDFRREKGTHDLNGTVAIAEDLAHHGGAAAIRYACLDLSKKMTAACAPLVQGDDQ